MLLGILGRLDAGGQIDRIVQGKSSILQQLLDDHVILQPLDQLVPDGLLLALVVAVPAGGSQLPQADQVVVDGLSMLLNPLPQRPPLHTLVDLAVDAP